MARASRAVGKSENPGVPLLFAGHNLPPLVEIGLTDLPKSEGAMADHQSTKSKQFQNGIVNNKSLCSGLKCRKRQKRQTGGQLLLFTKCVTLLYKNPTEIPVTH